MSPLPPSGIRNSAARILIVDDDFDSAEAWTMLLGAQGFDVRVALSAEEALTAVAEFTPHAALLDIGLPGINGYDLVSTLKANPALSGCRFVAVTGYDGAEARKRSASAGFDEHLVKPVSLPKLLAAIHAPALGLRNV